MNEPLIAKHVSKLQQSLTLLHVLARDITDKHIHYHKTTRKTSSETFSETSGTYNLMVKLTPNGPAINPFVNSVFKAFSVCRIVGQ